MSILSSIPNGPHWAVIQESSVYVPGDQRSRDAPGHGYPAHNEEVITYKAFTVKPDWEREIEMLTLQGKKFRAIRADVAKVGVRVEVEG